MTTTNQSPAGDESLACTIGALAPAERDAHLAEAVRLRAELLGFEHVTNGLRLRFRSGVDPHSLRAFAERDRLCCPFLTGVDVRQEADQVVLELATDARGAAFWIELFLEGPAPDPGANCGCPAGGGG